jgi:hypothetical protein
LAPASVCGYRPRSKAALFRHAFSTRTYVPILASDRGASDVRSPGRWPCADGRRSRTQPAGCGRCSRRSRVAAACDRIADSVQRRTSPEWSEGNGSWCSAVSPVRPVPRRRRAAPSPVSCSNPRSRSAHGPTGMRTSPGMWRSIVSGTRAATRAGTSARAWTSPTSPPAGPNPARCRTKPNAECSPRYSRSAPHSLSQSGE